ncbi:uncharacterized protein LOC143463026 [Clavelina lepadiformis]|uniref:uncharacterized protein LOC143463026 n=1 Tax=Clavelina lepadiformis TaxID=159417 RepID=UPI0040425AAD
MEKVYDNQTDHVCYEFDTSLLQLPPGLEQARRYSKISVASGFTFVATAASSLVLGVVCSRNGRCCFKIIMFMSLMASSVSAFLSAGSILRAVIEYDQEIQKSRQTSSSNVPLHMMLLQKRGNCIYYGWIGGGLLICGATMSLITAIAGIVVLYRKKNCSFTEVLDDRLQLVTSCET